MSHRKYRLVGLALLRSPSGDILIVDKDKGLRFFLNREAMNKAKMNDDVAASMFRQLTAFLHNHHAVSKDKPQSGQGTEAEGD